jgi:hypothetical protein
MNTNLRIVKSACLAALGISIAIATAACSSDDNNSSPTVDSGTPNTDATMTTQPDGSTTTTPDGAAAPTCDPDAGIGGSDTHNTCSTWGCAGFYDNKAHMVPNPLPTAAH